MQTISVEQFKLADKTVQSEIIKWWKPSEYDIVANFSSTGFVKEIGESGVLCYWSNEKYEKWQQKEELIPLLTVGQLIEFIESKTEYYLEIKYDESNDYGYIFNIGLRDMKHYSRYVDLLKALWELAEVICEKI